MNKTGIELSYDRVQEIYSDLSEIHSRLEPGYHHVEDSVIGTLEVLLSFISTNK